MAEVKAWLGVLGAALDGMKVSGPKSLVSTMDFFASRDLLTGKATNVLTAAMADKQSPLRELFAATIQAWDYQGTPDWTKTAPNTRERRDEIEELLGLPKALAAAVEQQVPPKLDEEHEIVITDGRTQPWYTPEHLRDREFYWPAYRRYLAKKKKLPVDTLHSLHEASNRVLEHLAPPHSKVDDPRRGLVVGYVQSGKTTNFTAVIAKAIDAGFRLIIVLAGTIDLLREQTQRRLDMELVGVENLGLRAEDEEAEYKDDAAYPEKFISYGKEPRELRFPNIRRLTSSTGDFRRIDASFQALAFDEIDPALGPASAIENIKRSNARLIVIKKNPTRLRQLITEIKNSRKVRETLPTLIIDDESDQASVNTRKRLSTDIQRTRTNARIVQLLEVLPRAQYIGYTATPFANVFVDPGDAADIFPKDFIISLPRPAGYMGVSDFHDLGESPSTLSNQAAHVRKFKDAGAGEALDRALDAFLISGAIKLYRASRDVPGDLRHHTMMIHESVSNTDQLERVEMVSKLWRSAGYDGTRSGPERLKQALEAEFAPVSRVREPKLPFPKSYAELKPFIGSAFDRICNHGPAIVVNGTPSGVNPGFDGKDPVWKIIIGGAKLSRGFTVEGLTTTFFRRRSKQQDTLLQMGRWYGYRAGYKDLVRLYLEEGEPGEFDLYEAFEGICRDEEAFRAQLSQYSKTVTPKQVPALVYNSYPGLRPTSKNKMFNAELVSAGISGWTEKGFRSVESNALKKNWAGLERLVSKGLKSHEFEGTRFLLANSSRRQIVEFLDSFVWSKLSSMGPEIAFLRENKHVAAKWIIALPQLKAADTVPLGGEACSIHLRSREGDDFGAFSDKQRQKMFDLGEREQQGVLVVYPTQPKDEKRFQRPVVGFGIYHPKLPEGLVPVAFTVRDQSHKDAVVVSPKSKSKHQQA